jgi:hypothetical protein
MRLKQRIVRILVHEIVADVDEEASEVLLLLHWAGGRHSELRVKKNATGKHRRCTAVETVDVIRQMAGRFSDQQIAATLNRLGLRTGNEHTWTEGRVRSARNITNCQLMMRSDRTAVYLLLKKRPCAWESARGQSGE